MSDNPSDFKSPDRPVSGVTWYQARKYCDLAGGRLPTEAEWEYAARAGSKESRYGALDAIAWYKSNSGGQTQPVGKKEKNAWGLYDMLGNVMEWVEDWYAGDYYLTLPARAVDPKGAANGRSRVFRGGDWNSGPGKVRASERGYGEPAYSYAWGTGVRCARDVIP